MMIQFTLPNHEHAPTVASQIFHMLPITRLVAVQLWEPVVDARLRHSTAILMMVPETAMYKDHGTTGRKDEIGAAREIAPMEPVAIAKRMNETTNEKLRLRVLAADARHAFASVGF